MGNDYDQSKKKTSRRTLFGVTSNEITCLRKAHAEIVIDEGVGKPKTTVQALVVLNELSPSGVALFAEAPFSGDQPVTVNIPGLKNFFVKGLVSVCKQIPVNAGIVSDKTFQFRVEITFTFQNEDERNSVVDYCQFLSSHYLSRAA